MTKLPLAIAFLSLLSIPFTVNSQVSDELTTLLKLKQQWGDPPPLASWNASSPPCSWPEVTCASGSVTELNFNNYNFTGEIPPIICNLKNLTALDLSLNYIPGEFPTALYNCSKLQYLDLSQNYFAGAVPADIHKLQSLQFIDIGGNNFSGDIPPAVGRLSELRTLNLYMNGFEGTFPAEIGDLANLETLRMAINNFSPAEIPAKFGNLKKLRYLWMAECNLVGEIPTTFTNLSNLEHIDLSMNLMSGSVPEGLFLLQNLKNVYLFHNKLSGRIPSTIAAAGLLEVDLAMNNLSGPIPVGFGNLQNLSVLNLYWNQLSGEIPPIVGKIPSLRILKLFHNNLTGVLPPELGLHSKLDELDVSVNDLSGELPKNLCSGGALTGLVAYSNNLTGEIPPSLEKCSTLRSIQLYKNSFSGEVPSGIWILPGLWSLMISRNSFSGTLPNSTAWNLTRIEISDNRFSGHIPIGIEHWSNLAVLKASNNQLSGTMPAEITALSKLITLFLDGNQLSGEFPAGIISWRSLNTLNVSRNKLSGPIPSSIGSLPDLLNLDMSENQFSGEIPPELGDLKLTVLNLSSNKLAGEIPDQYNNLAYENSFLNNPGLCANRPILKLRTCYANKNSDKLSSKNLALILVLAVFVFVVTVVSSLVMFRDYRRKKLGRDLSTWKLTSFHRLDFTEANILSNLTEGNLIGSGGSGKVYRIGVGGPEEYVAVKRIWNNRKLDLQHEKEFVAEVEILGTIRHTNIVKLLCCISSEDSRLLVYEYKENESLDRWVHRSKRKSISSRAGTPLRAFLDWPTRLRVAIGAARGLCYMHHDCSPPIIHRDVKSSNILLDSKFNASIADFGLAKMVVKHGEAQTMSVVAGSFGYFAPEYAYTTKVNEKIDVYSFGVVLLELVTGREANCGEDNLSLAEWTWRHFGEDKPIDDIVDEDIKEVCYLEDITAVFKLGLICTSTLPSTRPSMKEVLQVLQNCSPLEGQGKKVGRDFDVTPLLGNETYLSSYRKSRRLVDGDGESLIFSV